MVGQINREMDLLRLMWVYPNTYMDVKASVHLWRACQLTDQVDCRGSLWTPSARKRLA